MLAGFGLKILIKKKCDGGKYYEAVKVCRVSHRVPLQMLRYAMRYPTYLPKTRFGLQFDNTFKASTLFHPTPSIKAAEIYLLQWVHGMHPTRYNTPLSH